jgi:hypothetical protein
MGAIVPHLTIDSKKSAIIFLNPVARPGIYSNLIRSVTLMTQSPITVTYDIKELFDKLEKKIDDRFDRLEEKVNKLEIGQAALITEVETIKKDVSEIKGSQRSQIWSLIGIIGAAVLSGIVIAIWRTALMGRV